jgi:hypothetical protein
VSKTTGNRGEAATREIHKESFMRIRTMLWLALVLTFGVPGVSPASAEGAAQSGTNREAVTRIYKSGDKFVVAVYRADGSAALGLLELPKSASQDMGKAAAAPTLADLKDWRVVATVEVAANGAAGPLDVAAGKPGNSKLTRKQRSELFKQTKVTASVLDTINKGLATGTPTGGATSETNRTP